MRVVRVAFFILLFAILTLYVSSAAAQQEQTQPAPAQPPDPKLVEAVTQWFSSNAIPLKTVEARNGFDDLKPLEKVLRNARIVALGEATHGTREFFQFKHRMLEFLVTRMGFEAFGIEASYPACMNVNDYVVYGRGDRAKALASQGFWTWDTNEVSDMIDWMREYNSNLPENKRIRFLGYDIQNYTQAFDVINTYLKKVAPDFLPTAEASFQPLRMADKDPVGFMKTSAEAKLQLFKNSDAVVKFLEENKAKFVKQTSKQEFETVLLHARVLFQYADAYGLGPMWDQKNPANSGGAKRDRYMAENIQTLINQLGPGTKMVVWAHNGHIAASSYGGGIPAMGSYLRKAYGDGYYALGFTFNEGSFQSREMIPGKTAGALKEFTVGPAPEFSTGWYFARAREGRKFENYVVDFRGAPKQGIVAEWLSSPHPSFSVGSGFSTEWKVDQYMAPEILRNDYDGMIFINKTTRARPNPTGMRGPM
jgi:erythromycin esterase